MNEINKTKKILIVEDEQILGEIIRDKLSSEGYQIFLARDGEEGIAKMKELKPDLVFLDIIMPKKNGLEVLEDAQKDDTLKNIPVVVISNSGQRSEIERAVGLGVRDYIIKAQFSPDDILEKVRKYLNQEYKETISKPGKIEPSLKNIKILLAEDDEFLLSLLAQRIEKEGYRILSATNGKQVLKIFEENTPDLVLLDIVMPEMNGIEVLKNIRSQEKYKDTIIIIFSNLGQEHEVEEAKKAGADDFLVKVNFTIKEVVEKICNLLKQKGKI
ncbi:MAG: response regulator [bacterium]|nr:response regulator [bacterium]